jgi:hypothetical protein
MSCRAAVSALQGLVVWWWCTTGGGDGGRVVPSPRRPFYWLPCCCVLAHSRATQEAGTPVCCLQWVRGIQCSSMMAELIKLMSCVVFRLIFLHELGRAGLVLRVLINDLL